MATDSEEKAGGRWSCSSRRKTKFIRKDLQLKIILGTLFVAIFVLAFSLQVPFIGLRILQEVSPQSVQSVFGLFTKLLWTSLGLSVLVTIPLSVWMGVAFSFRFCGPIHRIKQYFEGLASGRWDSTLSLRKSDDLQDVKDVINNFMDSARERLRGQHEALEAAREALLKGRKAIMDPVEADRLICRIDSECARLAERLGSEGLDGRSAISPVKAAEIVPEVVSAS